MCNWKCGKGKIFENFSLSLEEPVTLATTIKLAMASNANTLIRGYYILVNTQTNSLINISSKIIKVNEGRFLNEELPDGRRITRDISLTDSPSNFRRIQGQVAFQILYQRDKPLPYSQNQFIEKANNIPLPSSVGSKLGISKTRNNDNKPDFSTSNTLKKTPCNQDILKNLQLRDFRLGMTSEEVLKILPKSTIKTINTFEKSIIKDFSSMVVKIPKYENISSIQLQFFDNRLYSIGVSYDNTIRWKNLNEFALQVEKSLGLPQMKGDSYDFDGKYLFCGDYQIKAILTDYVGGIPTIHLFDTTVFSKIQKRKQEEKDKSLLKKIEEEKRKQQMEEEKKKGFKP